MRLIQINGSLPGTINEHLAPGAWTGQLSIAGDLYGLVGIETTGPQAIDFSASYDAANGLINLVSAARLNYADFVLAGLTPEADFGLRFVFSDGSFQDGTDSYAVRVAPVHDGPPLGLSFSSGGNVAAGAIGAPIGILAVSDPSWDGPFTFSFDSNNDWRFTVVGNILALQSGISLGLDDQGTLPLLIDVSDGRYHAAFALNITVTAPSDPLAVVHVLAAGEEELGFVLSSASAVTTLRAIAEVASIIGYAGGFHEIILAGGGVVWLPPLNRLEFGDGILDFTSADWTSLTHNGNGTWTATHSADPADSVTQAQAFFFQGLPDNDLLPAVAVADADLLNWQLDGDFSPGSGTGPDWQLLGTADFNGDGTQDSLYQSTTSSGLMLIWQLINGSESRDIAAAGAGEAWQAIGVGDFNHEGAAGIRFRNIITDQLADWHLAIGVNARVMPGGGSGADW